MLRLKSAKILMLRTRSASKIKRLTTLKSPWEMLMCTDAHEKSNVDVITSNSEGKKGHLFSVGDKGDILSKQLGNS